MKRARDPDALRQVVLDRKLTQRQLAQLAGCSKGTIGFLLNGQRAVNDQLARRLARVLKCPLDVLFVDSVSTAGPLIVDESAVA